jgi:hypothetical protein
MQVWKRTQLAVAVIVALGLVGSACNDPSPPSEPRGLVAMTDGLSGDEPWRQDFAFADMDGDGMRDLVTAPPRKSREPWPHIFLRRPGRWESVVCSDVAQNRVPKV